MQWPRIVILFVLSGGVALLALLVVPGADPASLLAQAECLLLLPWLAALVSFPLKALGRGILDGFRRAPLGGEISARVLRSLGGLTWAAGLLCLLVSYLQAIQTMAMSRGNVDLAAAVPGIIAAMLVPVAFALILRLALYDRAARALEAACGAREAVPAN